MLTVVCLSEHTSHARSQAKLLDHHTGYTTIEVKEKINKMMMFVKSRRPGGELLDDWLLFQLECQALSSLSASIGSSKGSLKRLTRLTASYCHGHCHDCISGSQYVQPHADICSGSNATVTHMHMLTLFLCGLRHMQILTN